MRLFASIGQRFNRNKKNSKKTKHENPSIVDFVDKSTLAAAMGGKKSTHSIDGSSVRSLGSEESSMSSFGDSVEISPVEWTLPLVDETTTDPQTMEEEMKRLQVLNSYFVLDSDGEEAFDRITELGATMFNVPICLISLVDLGRQWFLSKVGLDAAETARKHAFCAHVILNKYKMLVIPDATKDFRFKDNPLVTDGLKIRFYAGAALVSKEGYKLGTVCIISPNVRPQGLTDTESKMLHNLAAMTIGAMEARRNRLLKEEYETKFHSLARTFLDTTHHLEEAKDCVEKAMVLNSWGGTEEEYKTLNTAVEILEVQSKMCSAAMKSTLQDITVSDTNTNNNNNKTTKDTSSEGDDDDGCLDREIMENPEDMDNPITDMKKLFDNINSIIGNFPRQDVVSVEIEKTIPKTIVCDDLLLFRAVLNTLTHCMGASAKGTPCGIRIRRMKRDDNELLVQCLLGGKPISKKEAKLLFENRETLLAPVASIVRSMGGHYGMYEAKWDPTISKSEVQSIFWFQVPYDTPEKIEKLSRNLIKIHPKPDGAKTAGESSTNKNGIDPFQQALLAGGCGQAR
ncbi:two-component hybrid sensor and regulator [Nitzschia inconspicua]|uniref:Two-component hybrid sensor and regulator n=1 Tax=Nitzschia inconspicua TaxID=303405 RepID=A0A9K3Q5X7_9STRA|nr:two-component hybrid sensor and regulator [Nitzschia inconspicua]